MRRLLLAAAALTALAVTPAAHAWTWPVDGPVLRPFSLSADPYAAGQHRGIDLGAPEGERVRAPAAGTVSFVGSVPNGGRAVTILTADGYAVTLLQLGSAAVVRDAVLEEGAPVGTVGPSADAVTAQSHVHLGVRAAADPHGYLDPLGFLPPRPQPPPASAQPQPLPPPAPAVEASAPQPAPAVVAEAPPAAAAAPTSTEPSSPAAVAPAADAPASPEPIPPSRADVGVPQPRPSTAAPPRRAQAVSAVAPTAPAPSVSGRQAQSSGR